MAEKDFQTELMRGFEKVGGHAYKIPDIPVSQVRAFQRFTPKKPYDCYWLISDYYHALELKQVQSGMSFSLANLKDHQEEALLAVEAEGGFGWLAVNFRLRLSKAQQAKLGAEVLDVAFAVRIHAVVAARTSGCRSNLPLDWFQRTYGAIELPQLPQSPLAWDPRPLAAVHSRS